MRPRRGLLGDRDFRQLFLADTISQLGTRVSMLALPLIAVVALNASPIEVGLLSASGTVAFVVLGLPAGAWVDRVRRQPVLVAADLGRTGFLGLVPLLWWADLLTIVHLYVVSLMVGVLTVFFDVAYQSYLPHLVGRSHLVEGNAKLESVRAVTDVAGRGLAGPLIQALTAPFAVLADAVSYGMSAWFVIRIRRREARPHRRARPHLGREIGEGLRFVLGNPCLRAIGFCTGSYVLFAAMTHTMIVVLLARDLGLTPLVIGLVLAVGSCGALVGALSARAIGARLGQGPAIWLSLAITAPFGLLVPLASRGWGLWATTVGWAVTSFGVVVYNVVQVSLRQSLTPERLLGRMNATMRTLAWGPLPLGGAVAGLLGQVIGVRPTMWLAAVGTTVAFVPVYLSPLRSLREPTTMDSSPAAS
jgi:MFS family permease